MYTLEGWVIDRYSGNTFKLESTCVIANRDDLLRAGGAGSNPYWDYGGNSKFVCDFTVLNLWGLPYFHAALRSL